MGGAGGAGAASADAPCTMSAASSGGAGGAPATTGTGGTGGKAPASGVGATGTGGAGGGTTPAASATGAAARGAAAAGGAGATSRSGAAWAGAAIATTSAAGVGGTGAGGGAALFRADAAVSSDSGMVGGAVANCCTMSRHGTPDLGAGSAVAVALSARIGAQYSFVSKLSLELAPARGSAVQRLEPPHAYLVRGRPDLARRGRGTPAIGLNARGGPLSRQSACKVLQDAAEWAGITAAVPRTRCGTRSPPTCSMAAPMCGSCRNCSDMLRYHDADLHAGHRARPARGVGWGPSAGAVAASRGIRIRVPDRE
jgi:hypothetical protein